MRQDMPENKQWELMVQRKHTNKVMTAIIDTEETADDLDPLSAPVNCATIFCAPSRRPKVKTNITKC